jgi:DinB superfamily
MRQMELIFPFLLLLGCGGTTLAQTERQDGTVLEAQSGTAAHGQADQGAARLDAQREKRAMQVLLKAAQTKIVSAADAMPADKYGFAPTDGEFKGVRTFGQEVKHLAATNFILAAAALGEDPPTDAGDETGPETARTKAEILDYLLGSFARLGQAIDAIGNNNAPVKSSPISPLKNAEATRLALAVESMSHALNHYGQMVEYLRMNGIVPPASRP